MNSHLNVVNGELVDSLEYFESFNPATAEPIGRVPISTREQVDAAVAAARGAQPAWASLSDDARKNALQRVADFALANAHRIFAPVGRHLHEGLQIHFRAEKFFEFLACLGSNFFQD